VPGIVPSSFPQKEVRTKPGSVQIIMSDRILNWPATRRGLAPGEKYEMFVPVLTGRSTQREAAARWGVDRSAVVHVCRVAWQGALGALASSVPGRPGQSGCEAALARAGAGISRLRAAVTGLAVARTCARGKPLGTDGRPGPAGCAAGVKAGLPCLAGQAMGRGWAARRAAAFVGLDHARRDAGRLDDAPPGGHPLHGLLAWEHAAVVGLSGAWGGIGRSRRMLARRGSRIGLVHVSGSAVRRVLAGEGLVLGGPPPRDPVPRTPWPDWLEWKPDRIWAYDCTCWARGRRAAIAILDVVSGTWLAALTSAEESSAQAGACFLAAPDAGDLLEEAGERATAAPRAAIASGGRDRVAAITADGQLPLLLRSPVTGRRCARPPPGSSWPGSRSTGSPVGRQPPGPGLDRTSDTQMISTGRAPRPSTSARTPPVSRASPHGTTSAHPPLPIPAPGHPPLPAPPRPGSSRSDHA
jgi:hypothetical protein